MSLPASKTKPSLAEDCNTKQFYAEYKSIRQELIKTLHRDYEQVPINRIITKSQKILNRIIFICFCENIGLLPDKTLFSLQDSFSLWDALRKLFKGVDHGCIEPVLIKQGYNGELFKEDVDLDVTITVSNSLCRRLINLSAYDFSRDLPADILGRIFEQSIDDLRKIRESYGLSAVGRKQKAEEKRHKEGIYYTPKYIVETLIESTLEPYVETQEQFLRQKYSLPSPTTKSTLQVADSQEEKEMLVELQEWLLKIKILDPACGSGAFLVAVYDYLLNKHRDLSRRIQKPPSRSGYRYSDEDYVQTILQNNLYGVDKNAESVELTKLSLWLRSARKNEKLKSLAGNIRQGNSLLTRTQDPDGFDWSKGFESVPGGRFDVILGNPPYVRQELIKDIKPALQKNFPEVYTGTADLYVYFYALGLRLLKPHGYLGFISSNKFMRCQYGRPLRSELRRHTLTTVVDEFSTKVFTDAVVDPCILTLRKTSPAPNHTFDHNQSLYPQTELEPAGWSFAPVELKKIFAKMRANSRTLKETEVEINYGIKTGYNDAFIIDQEKYKELIQQDSRSREIIHPLLRGGDIKKYSATTVNQYLIGTFPALNLNIDDYPAIKQHLIPFKEKLVQSGEKGSRKKTNNTWFETQDQIQYYRNFEEPKIIWPEIVANHGFYYDVNGTYLNNKAFLLTSKVENLPFFTGILNSRCGQVLCTYQTATLGKKGHEYRKIFIEQIPIPTATPRQQESIAGKVEEILRLVKEKQKRLFADQKYLEEVDVKINLATYTWHKRGEALAKIAKSKVAKRRQEKFAVWLESELRELQALEERKRMLEESIDQEVYVLYNLTRKEIRNLQQV